MPTNNVSWYEVAQFCNWLTSGDKSKGVYQFSGNNANPGNFLGINRISAQTTYGKIYAIPTEDEWYKAAYFKPDGSGYTHCEKFSRAFYFRLAPSSMVCHTDEKRTDRCTLLPAMLPT
jgi:hypothetical protein